MKHLSILIVTVSVLMALETVSWAQDKRPEKPQFKGVELYSWKEEGDGWVFVMLDGTNEEKTMAEIKGSKKRIKGVENVKKAFASLAVGEQVSWTHRIEGFAFPPEGVRKEIKEAAEMAKITLRIAGDKN